MKRTVSILFVLAAVLALAAPSHGTLAFYEGFDYPITTTNYYGDPAGDLTDPPWTVTRRWPHVVSPGLTYTGLVTEGSEWGG